MMFYFYGSYKAFATFRKHKDNGEVETKTVIGTARIISDTLPKATYASCGWDLVNSIHIDIGKGEFPTFSDLQKHLTAVIEESSYSADAKGDYTGALVTRVSSLTNGINGSIFCALSEISNAVLFDQNTIVDLSRVGSSETKALIMGILVMKLNEYRMSEGAGMGNGKYRFYAPDDSEYTAEEISAMILKRVKADCEEAIGSPVSDAVITVPAYFDSAQRQATVNGSGFFRVRQNHDRALGFRRQWKEVYAPRSK